MYSWYIRLIVPGLIPVAFEIADCVMRFSHNIRDRCIRIIAGHSSYRLGRFYYTNMQIRHNTTLAVELLP